ncbi:hypothetical protein M1437_01735 [Patescibacteria group bacterium]|nr:hypothetical protein [Patescibacteria group bacterium]
MGRNPEKITEIMQRAAEIPLTAWNCVVPRHTQSIFSTSVNAVMDGIAISSIINPPKIGIELTVAVASVAVVFHYLDRKRYGDWRIKDGQED